MSSGGHNRKPKQLKVIRGTFRADRNPANEPDPTPVVDVPKPPTHLNRWGKRLWKSLVPKLMDTRVLTDVDLPSLEIACMQYGIYRELDDAIRCFVRDSRTGKRRRRTLAEYLRGQNSQTIPEYSAMKQAFTTWKSYMAEFGLSPASRNRIDLPQQEGEEDPMEALLNEG